MSLRNTMSKIFLRIFLLALIILFFSLPAQANGSYDGIYSIAPFGFTNISERDGAVIFINIYNDDWERVIGKRIWVSGQTTQCESQLLLIAALMP